mmetsp:Transcript_34342/g.50835  ORF Transcript_34342/g.50835 Transcript_34342/m.50835 type:complete len:112 (-) Transcript_34342:166-501(-)
MQGGRGVDERAVAGASTKRGGNWRAHTDPLLAEQQAKNVEFAAFKLVWSLRTLASALSFEKKETRLVEMNGALCMSRVWLQQHRSVKKSDGSSSCCCFARFVWKNGNLSST